MPELPTFGRLAGIDYGTVRIGVAVTDPDRRFASPLLTYTRQNEVHAVGFFRELAASERIAAFVVGLPVHLSGEESEKSREARDFAQWLGTTTDLPVILFDERFTTSEADAILAQGRLTSAQRKERRDMLAAQQMLTAFLEAGQKSESPKGLEE